MGDVRAAFLFANFVRVPQRRKPVDVLANNGNVNKEKCNLIGFSIRELASSL